MEEDKEVDFILGMNKRITESDDPRDATIARLARSIGQIVPHWAEEEFKRDTSPSDVLTALIHIEAAMFMAVLDSVIEDKDKDEAIKLAAKGFYLSLKELSVTTKEKQDGEPQRESERW